jgi:uncharacterized membrane protein
MMNFWRLLRKNISELTRYPGFLLIGWLAVTLSLPLFYRLFGLQSLIQWLTLSILLQTAFVLNVLYRAWGWWGMLRVTAAVLLLVWIVQAIILRSGLPYGDLQYTSLWQPELLGVPFIIPATWLMMLPPSWVMSRLLTRKLSGCLMRFLFVLASAVAFTGWILSFDPFLAHLGIIIWTPPGDFYGIPWPNYLFWLFLAALLTFAISPKHHPGGSLLLLYTLVWLVEFIAVMLIGGLVLPALVGFVVMGGFVLGAGIMSGN